MNIQEAKAEIAHTFRAYMRRNPDGTHRIPIEKQRPVLLIGPPGIGKTAIMKQIAQETGCALVAYAMTHHTRQSAIGLPYIAQKEYGGKIYSVTEYTMSEIVASIYDTMAVTGKTQGILFLDEINCVSETLAPVMLQLLQNKTFGNVPLPEDWVIVAAGNPPEYNKSVREMDMVTLDRVKHIEVEAELGVWQSYALAQGVHPAVRTYLSVYPDHFYRITDTDRGQLFVTARGWEDLSLMLTAYEEAGISVGVDWFLQYLQHDEIARSFGLYYDLFCHFSRALGDEVALSDRLMAMPDDLKQISPTQCLALAAMLYHPIEGRALQWQQRQSGLIRQRELLSLMPDGDLRAFFAQKRQAIHVKVDHGVMKPAEEFRDRGALDRLESDVTAWEKLDRAGRGAFSDYEAGVIDAAEAANREDALKISEEIEAAYRVLEACPEGRSARLYLTHDLAAAPHCAALLREFPSEAWQRYREELEV